MRQKNCHSLRNKFVSVDLVTAFLCGHMLRLALTHRIEEVVATRAVECVREEVVQNVLLRFLDASVRLHIAGQALHMHSQGKYVDDQYLYFGDGEVWVALLFICLF